MSERMEDPSDACLALGPFNGHPETSSDPPGAKHSTGTSSSWPFCWRSEGLQEAQGSLAAMRPPSLTPSSQQWTVHLSSLPCLPSQEL